MAQATFQYVNAAGSGPLQLQVTVTGLGAVNQPFQFDFAFTAGRLWDKGKNVPTLDRAAELLAIPFYAAGAEQGPSGVTFAP